MSDLVKDDVAKGATGSMHANGSMHDGSKRQRDVADPFDFPEGVTVLVRPSGAR